MLRILALLLLIGTCEVASAQDPGEETGVVDRTGANPSTPVRRPGTRERTERQVSKPFSDPRRWLFLAVVGFLVIGGGRKWLHGRKGRRLADRLHDGTAPIDDIRNANRYGRIVVHDLFRVLTDGKSLEHRAAATEALIKLWRADELIPEEEKAIVTRSFTVDWRIRRKYPKGLTGPIAVVADFGLPELADRELSAWLADHLQWSFRVNGTRRASDDSWHIQDSEHRSVRLTFMGEDFPDAGPHRLILHMKVDTIGLTDQWTLELPAQTISFEFDDKLQLNALAGMPDSARADIMNASVKPRTGGEHPEPVFSVLDDRFALRNPPVLALRSALPSDLAHCARLELEGVSGQWTIGEWIVASKTISGSDGEQTAQDSLAARHWPERLEPNSESASIERGGHYRARVVLESRPERGWSDPDVRSVWPETITSEWFDVEIVRR
jgi:hypothetical protein